ncbi:hypothetical protein EV368DRAFT_88250 [Lentinula lateritia]|nr:hypothetical protein EV368DRAFT_88250 [Lentinula lateritia]
MSSSRTTTKTTNTVGSIPITGGTDPRPLAPTRPSTLNASDKEWELEKQLERNQERLQKLKEKRKAEEAAKKKAEEAARWAAEEEKKKREAAAQAVQARKLEEEAVEKRRKKEGGSNLTGEPLVVLESQMAQLLADNRQLQEGQVRANTYDQHIIKKLDWLMRDAARRRELSPEAPVAGPSELPKKRRRVIVSEEEQEKERDRGGEEGEEEEGEPVPKKVQSVKGKEREE